jgi:hypothetical protein
MSSSVPHIFRSKCQKVKVNSTCYSKNIKKLVIKSNGLDLGTSVFDKSYTPYPFLDKGQFLWHNHQTFKVKISYYIKMF